MAFLTLILPTLSPQWCGGGGGSYKKTKSKANKQTISYNQQQAIIKLRDTTHCFVKYIRASTQYNMNIIRYVWLMEKPLY